jgi:hypothetical protein
MTMNDEPIVTKTGKVLTDADIEALVEEAERGYDVSKLTPRTRPDTASSSDLGMDVDERVVGAAARALAYAADKRQINLGGHSVVELAQIVATVATETGINVGFVVLGTRHRDVVEHAERRERQWSARACAAEAESDRRMVRLQQALAALDDQALAATIAEKVGLMLRQDTA